MSAVAWVAAWKIDPQKEFVSLSRNCHLSLRASGVDARFVAFNDASYGPYSGSIIGISSINRATQPDPSVRGFGDAYGIYFRLIQWRNGNSLWTVAISLLYPLTLFCIAPIIWLVARSRRQRRGFPVDAAA